MDMTSIHQLAYLYSHQQEIAEEFGINRSVTERDFYSKESKRETKDDKEVTKSETKKRVRTQSNNSSR